MSDVPNETVAVMIDRYLPNIVNALRAVAPEYRDPALVARLLPGVHGYAVPVWLVERIGRDANLLPRTDA